MTAKDPEFALEYFKQIETLATDILSDRRDIIEYNKKRDKVREASRFVVKFNDGLAIKNVINGLVF